MEKKKEIEQKFYFMEVVEIPFGPELSTTEYAARSVEPTFSEDQRKTLKRIFKALEYQGAEFQTNNGPRPVTIPAHVINWFLDACAATL